MNTLKAEKLAEAINIYSSRKSFYWYPLDDVSCNVPVVAYDIVQLYKNGCIKAIESVLKTCNIDKVTTVQMDFGTVFENDDIYELLYEIDEYGYGFPYTVETFYFDDTKEWLIYVSHEETISFTGDKIAKVAQAILPEKYMIRW